jgi:phenylacetate-CoA ligase
VEGMPLLRFRTGDICIAYDDPCACGRTGRRLGPVLGRKNQMIKLKGTTLYPAAIYDVLDGFEGVENYQVIAGTNGIGTDELQIDIGIKEAGSVSISELSDTFRARLRVLPEINLLKPSEVHAKLFPGTNRKPLIFVDKRNH